MKDKRILIIDDDVELCEEVAEVFRDEGHSVTNISDPKESQELIDNGTFDIVIVDYKMPGLNGIELVKNIKKKNPKICVFIASGRPFIEKLIEEEKVAHLVSGVISKPFNCAVLLEKIKSAY